MEVEVKKSDSGKTVVETKEKNHTVMSLFRKYLWDSGVTAGYDEGHPYLGGSKLVVESEDVEKEFEEAIRDIKSDLKNFKSSF